MPEPTAQSQENVQPQHHIPIPLPQPQLVDPSIDNWKELLETDLDRNVDIEENSPFQEGIISETYERPDKSYVQDPYELKDLIDTTKLVQKFLPKQTDIDKILDIIKRKVLKGTHLPLTIKEIQAGYLGSLYFKDLYLFLSQNKLPSKTSSIKKVETLAENFVLIDSLLCNCPSPDLLVSISKRNGLLKSPKANTGASRHAFLSISKAICASLVSITCSLFLLALSPDRCLCSGCTTWANPLIDELVVMAYQTKKGSDSSIGLRQSKFSHSF